MQKHVVFRQVCCVPPAMRWPCQAETAVVGVRGLCAKTVWERCPNGKLKLWKNTSCFDRLCAIRLRCAGPAKRRPRFWVYVVYAQRPSGSDAPTGSLNYAKTRRVSTGCVRSACDALALASGDRGFGCTWFMRKDRLGARSLGEA